MTSATPFDPDDTIVDGLIVFANAMGDVQSGQTGAAMYRTVANAFRSNIQASDECRIAFPSMIIRPDLRKECFVAILASRVIVAWSKGMLKKTVEHELIPREAITSASWEISQAGNTRGATLLTIEHKSGSTTVALPKGKTGLADLIRDSVVGAATS